MNKKIMVLIISVVVILLIGGGIVLFKNRNSSDDKLNSNISGSIDSDKKVLVVYYSAQNHTEAVALKIAESLNADVFELVPEDIYTSEDLNWNNSSSRVSREYNDEDLRNVKLVTNIPPNFDEYDTILIGYPIWWGIAAWPVDSFIEANDFSGKTVIPFCTSSSSGLGQSGTLLRDLAGTGNWLEGHRFTSNPSDTDIKNWIDSLQ